MPAPTRKSGSAAAPKAAEPAPAPAAPFAAPTHPACARCRKPLPEPAAGATLVACPACGEPNYIPRGGQHGPSPAVVDYAPLAPVPPAAPADAATDRLAANLAAPARTTGGRREPPHVVVLARAGTGKTTTLVGGIQVMLGLEPRDAAGRPMTPSPQQAAVWEALRESAPRPGAKWYSVCFAAFNRDIAAELRRRLPADPRLSAKTMHALGAAAVYKAFRGQLLPGDDAVNEDRVSDLIAGALGEDLRSLRRTKPLVLRAARELVSLCKMNLLGLGWKADDGRWDEALDALAERHDVEVDAPAWKEDPNPDSPAPPSVRDVVFPLVPALLERCKDVAKDGCFDMDDMVWLPTALNLPVWQNDVLLVDEVQDLSRAQQALARRAGKRLIMCGDDRQSIYGFAGADSDSMPRMTRELEATPRGCRVLPLTVTRRCGRKIVEEARAYVQDFSAHESNPEGVVSTAAYPLRRERKADGSYEWVTLPLEQTYVPLVKDGDMVLCRANAPLVRECFRFLKLGRRAKIRGRKIGDQLVALVEKLGAADLPDLIARLSDWLVAEVGKEMAERNPSENKLQALQDRHDCVRAFVDVAHSVDDVKARIAALFTDAPPADGTDAPRGVTFSSVHKAKGLESDRVFFLDGFGPPMDKLQPWEREQAVNLRYIAVTRAIHEFVYVV